MNAEERRRLQELDDMVQDSTREDLARIQDADRRTQMEGVSLYDACVDPARIVGPGIKGRHGRQLTL